MSYDYAVTPFHSFKLLACVVICTTKAQTKFKCKGLKVRSSLGAAKQT